jgi:predicted nuclease with TOPRIM domain
MINNTLFIADNSPKNRNFQTRIKSAHANSKFTIDKEKLYDENLRLKSEFNKIKNEMEVTKKENTNLELELSKKDKLLEDLVIDSQNGFLTNLNNLNETGPLNKTLLGRITEVILR